MSELKILARARKKIDLVDLNAEFKHYERVILELIELRMLWTSVEHNRVKVQTDTRLAKFLSRVNNFDNLLVWWEGSILRV